MTGSKMNMHTRLKHQIKQLKQNSSDGNYPLEVLLAVVSKTYEETDHEKNNQEHDIQRMSEELQTLNRQVQRESESYLSMVMKNIVEGVVTYDENGQILHFNLAMEKMFQTSRKNMAGCSIESLSQADKETFPTIYDQYFNGTSTGPAYETIAVNNSGDVFPIDLTISKVVTQRGATFIAVVRDITERKNEQKALIEAKENALQTALTKTNFLSTMSHEIRTPMNAVIGLTNLLLQESPRKDQIENLNTLKFSGENLLVLIDDILDYNKIQAGKLNIEQTEFSLNEVIHNINKSLNMRAYDKKISLHIVTESGFPNIIIGDPTRLSQVLLNLIGNAIKFTESGKVTLTITSKQDTDERWAINFAIEDTGIGIHKDKIDTIFDNFTQSDANTTRKFGGTGLGLAITRQLLELQGSSIQVKSILGKGSIFSFTLQFETSSESSITAGNTPDDQDLIEHFEPVNVLLVEDSLVNQMVATKFLTKWGLTVDIAENGAVAIDKVKEKDYAVVLMDLHMPVMDGYTAAKNIRALPNEKYQQLPIIALTASTKASDQSDLNDAGINTYISKPFNPLELNQRIAQFIET
ncbi:MAG TPA: response regulator [Porticoccus sp.]|nr:response regulator [Porticoccus sp.]